MHDDEHEHDDDLELSDEQSDEVKGGVTMSDIQITKHIDKSTPILLPPSGP